MTALAVASPVEDGQAEARLKWVRFAQRILMVLIASVGLLGTILTSLSTAQAYDLLEQSLSRRAQSAGRAAAQAAFVPLMLEDEEALRTLVAALFTAENLAFLRIEDASGRLLAEKKRENAEAAPRVMEMSFPVVPALEDRRTGVDGNDPVGTIRLGIDRGDVDAEIRHAVMRNLTTGAALMAVVFIPAFFIVRGMTVRMEAMVGEVRLTEALRRSNEELESFAYVASHDLQEPLRMVASYTTLLGETYRGRLDKDADEYIAFAVDGANRMRRLIQDLLEYSRVRTQARPFEPVDLGEVVAESLKELRVAVAESSATVTADALPRVPGDRVQLRQVMQNLIGNALKYRGSDPPRVSITARREKDEWVVAVADNGIGIDMRHAERIFLPFQRLHTRREYPGTGIGLAIVRKIVERHGGSIRVESDGRSGTTFLFTLPADDKKGERKP